MPSARPTGVYLRPESTVFQIRILVPNDVRHLWKGASPIRQSLETSDRNEAYVRGHAIRADYLRQFQALRESIRESKPTQITDALVEHIAVKYEHDLLKADEAYRANPEALAFLVNSTAPLGRLTGRAHAPAATLNSSAIWADMGDYLNPDQHLHLGEIHGALLRAIKVDLAIGRYDQARAVAERACEALAIRVDWGQPVGRQALQRIMRAMARTCQAMVDRDAGEPVETPAATISATVEPAREPEDAPKTLRDVLPIWERRTSAKTNAVKDYKRALGLFEQAVGELPLGRLTKAVGARFVDFLLDPARGFKAKTAHNHASAINALVNIAEKTGSIERNPFDLRFDKSVGSGKRYPWTDNEIEQMFAHRLFSEQMDTVPLWRDVTQSDARAVLLILMHTGARVGEIAQLRKQDFQTRGGIETFLVTAEAGTVKTKESDRFVALASHLMADPWFAEWHASLEGDGRAFPSLQGRASTRPGDVFGRWFVKFREEASLPPGALNGTHRFRHWMRSTLAALNIAVTTQDAITGHETKGSSGTTVYTHTASPSVMLEALGRIDWPSVSQ
ncbi:DUF6538 domain-containing protein [Burkholderia gladioli]|uniref:DUF6538 domain-containing protein n=2 Tax=Burkholderia gladioli TaxID=28095 RepID=UPI000BBD256F|nr:DUF6538 domain-containing protein [Burkholderia gladioli]ATF85661.1 hypothetical protein CO712_11755 [Burkholderia gladioli pv. gladioli]MBJ9663703.1 tyrosine-type recombinase/integrase [Burkholderia gladioli]MBU9157109.1 tyrosine-type recombinase/integrase [Burkholderia gladioli]MCH7271902.1 tyrosine-type recombinase/integrase [Burkholderia gladioli]MEB2547721.1 DUF6538 domain-containing protein [Burkholderia gladioli]